LSDVRTFGKYLEKKCVTELSIDIKDFGTYSTDQLNEAFEKIAEAVPRSKKSRRVKWSEWQYTTALREMRQGGGDAHQAEQGAKKRRKPGTPAPRRGRRKRLRREVHDA
tara:strand:- start:1472 stop:1798 length:327 start_codon:yes stop_codon:yes gene_type:complete